MAGDSTPALGRGYGFCGWGIFTECKGNTAQANTRAGAIGLVRREL